MTPLPPPGVHKHDLEAYLATLLTSGTAIAACFLVIGMTIYLGAEHATVLNFRTFSPNNQNDLAGVARNATRLDGASLLQLGVALLILTPVARVFFTFVAFLVRRDWLYVAVTAIVLSVLAYGLLGGRVH
jgi:uncharacterized membrane protein